MKEIVDNNDKLFECPFFKDTQEFLRVLMDLLHEELKEPVPPVVTRQETSPRKHANRITTRYKRLLGGQKMEENINEELMQSKLSLVLRLVYELRKTGDENKTYLGREEKGVQTA